MSSRDSILARIKGIKREVLPLPPVYSAPLRAGALSELFTAALASVGGTVVESLGRPLNEIVRSLPIHAAARTVVSNIPELPGSMTINPAADPRTLAEIDLAIVQAKFGVCENGAVWIDPSELPHRGILFLAEHLIVLLSGDALVRTMDEGYQRLGIVKETGYFISGPSKTADIEQNLVIGAQGARSHAVILQ